MEHAEQTDDPNQRNQVIRILALLSWVRYDICDGKNFAGKGESNEGNPICSQNSSGANCDAADDHHLCSGAPSGNFQPCVSDCSFSGSHIVAAAVYHRRS